MVYAEHQTKPNLHQISMHSLSNDICVNLRQVMSATFNLGHFHKTGI